MRHTMRGKKRRLMYVLLKVVHWLLGQNWSKVFIRLRRFKAQRRNYAQWSADDGIIWHESIYNPKVMCLLYNFSLNKSFKNISDHSINLSLWLFFSFSFHFIWPNCTLWNSMEVLAPSVASALAENLKKTKQKKGYLDNQPQRTVKTYSAMSSTELSPKLWCVFCSDFMNLKSWIYYLSIEEQWGGAQFSWLSEYTASLLQQVAHYIMTWTPLLL